jgi:hypothetical protein
MIVGTVLGVLFSILCLVLMVYYKLKNKIDLTKLPPDIAEHYAHYIKSPMGMLA